MAVTSAFVQQPISSTLPAHPARYPCPPRRGCCCQGEAGEMNTRVLLSCFSTKTPFNSCWKRVALSYRLLDWSGQGVLSGFLFWPRSSECKHCEGMVIKAWGERDAYCYLQNDLHPILKKKPMKILQLHLQEGWRNFPSMKARAGGQSLALLSEQHPW